MNESVELQRQLAPAHERASTLAKLEQAIAQQNKQAVNILPQQQTPPPVPPQMLLPAGMGGFSALPAAKRDWTPIALLGGGLLAMVTILGSVAMISANSPAAVQERQLAAMNAVAIEASKQRSICIAFVCPDNNDTGGDRQSGSTGNLSAQPQPITPLPNPFQQQPQTAAPDPTWAWMANESNESIEGRIKATQTNPQICSQNPGFCEALNQQAQQRGI